MKTEANFEELLRLLENHKVEYVVVGGYAVAFYGYPRFTKDIDLFYKSSIENIGRLRKALIAFGFPQEALPDSLFLEPGNIVQFGVEPLRVDILNEIDGVSIDEVLRNSVRGRYGSVEIRFIGLDELIKNKESTGREQDRLDARQLRQTKNT